MEKIDFYGGLHGNFLELVINLFIYQIDVDNHSNWFNSNGACHTKNSLSSYMSKIKIRSNHYSYNNIKFEPNDLVIEIHCDQDYMLPALVNSLTRAGDQVLDISQLEIDTINKLVLLPKFEFFLKDLATEYGVKQNYSRSIIRNYFYSKFDSPELGLGAFNNFKHQGQKFCFPFRALFDIEQFYLYLNRCAFFLNMNFYPTEYTYRLWQEFMQKNQGFQSYQKCQQVIKSILGGKSMYTGDLNLVEEAWILYRLSTIFRCYDHPLLYRDNFPDNTKTISDIIYQWKSNDRHN
jgi:hypothetical protein